MYCEECVSVPVQARIRKGTQRRDGVLGWPVQLEPTGAGHTHAV
jgi:hypothetical protein